MSTEVVIPPAVKRTSLQMATLLAAGMLCALYIALCTKSYMAASFAGRGSFERAAQLEPSNAEYRYFLGVEAAHSLDMNSAKINYEAAVRLNPRMPGAWLDYAYALRASGDTGTATAALDRAIATAPTSLDVVFETASAKLAMGDRQQALPLFHELLQWSPGDADRIIELCWRAIPDINSLAGPLLGSDAVAYRKFLAFLDRHNEDRRNENAAAELLFQKYLLSSSPYDPALITTHVSDLIGRGKIEAASAAWDLALRHFPALAPYRVAGNLIVDPGFEQDPLNGGFSWRFQDSRNISFTIDQAHALEGSRALTVIFDGATGQDLGLSQLIAVHPGQQYTLAFASMAKDLASEGSPRISVLDAMTGERLAASQDLWQWSEWHRQSLAFDTEPGTRLVKLSLDREGRARELAGSLWLDAFSLR